MNDTTAIGTMPQLQDVHDYVTAVRSWLADLPSDEVEELTAGMEADLAERAAETGERLGILLGEPEAYAAELRSAAGLPPRVVPSTVAPPRDPGLIEVAVSAARSQADGILARWPWLLELRPTWWLARGAVLGWLVDVVLGTGRTVMLPLVGAALSLWLGLALRRREPLRPVMRVGLGAANVLAAMALLPMMSTYTSTYVSGYDDGYEMEQGFSSYGLYVTANGETVANLYAYDAAGNRLDGVRLFDQAGRRVLIDTSLLFNDPAVDVPIRPEDGMPDVAADVLPLRWSGHDPWGDTGAAWTPPLVLAPVPGVEATVGSVPSATPSPSPSP